MKVFGTPTVPESQIPLLQDPVAPDAVPATVVQSLDLRLQERQQFEQMAQALLTQLRPEFERLAASAVRDAVKQAWLQHHPREG